MIFKKLVLIISSSFFLFAAQAQIKDVRVAPQQYDFGEVQKWKNPPAVFEIFNRGNKPLVFLPTFPQDDLLIELPEKPVAPNTSALVKLYYYTDKPGSFHRKARLFINISEQPIELVIEGNILSFDENALVACPTLTPKTFSETQSFIQDILVIDKNTRKPIEGVEVRIVGNNKEYKSLTASSGMVGTKIMLGLHDVMLSKQDYKPELRIFYLNKNTGLLTIEMEKAIPEEIKDIIVQAETMEFEEIETAKEDAKESVTVRKTEAGIPTTLIKSEIEPAAQELLPKERYSANNIVFLVDVSGSMRDRDKLPLLKVSMINLVEELRDIDKLSLVTYATNAEVIIAGVNADKKGQINPRIDSLKSYGWTNSVKGMEAAYYLAEKNYVFNGNNQIILATDGLFNNPSFDEKALFDLVKQQAAQGIKLSIIGFGDDVKAQRLMKKLAAAGQGNYFQISSENDMALIREIQQQSGK